MDLESAMIIPCLGGWGLLFFCLLALGSSLEKGAALGAWNTHPEVMVIWKRRLEKKKKARLDPEAWDVWR